jgi:hypothetical protein
VFSNATRRFVTVKAGRPRKHENNAAKQRAYRARLKKARMQEQGLEEMKEVVEEKIEKSEPRKPDPPRKPGICLAYSPRGTKCKSCGKEHK